MQISALVSMKRLKYLCVPIMEFLDGALLLGYLRVSSSANGLKSKFYSKFITPKENGKKGKARRI